MYNELSIRMEKKIQIKINHKGFKDEMPLFGQGFDFICGIITVTPTNQHLVPPAWQAL